VPERELVEQAKRGSGQAYEMLVRRYQDLAFRTAFLITGDAGDAEDATQSAFLKAYFHLSRFRSDAPFRPWILQIVANEAKNTRRAHQRHLLRTSEEARGDDLPAADPGPELRLIAHERSTWLVSNINALSEEDRLVIYCRFALDLTEAEMAGVLGCARGTVKSRLHRAIARLRARLEPELTGIDDRAIKER
jgi:RNA polymerase sigma-70 factor (ECF subfamily)